MLPKLRRRQHPIQRQPRGRQPRHIERQPPRQHLRRSIGRWFQPRCFQFREDKVVDGIARPRPIFHHRHRRLARRHVSPKFPPILQRHPCHLLRHRNPRTRVRRTHFHPLLQHRNRRIRQLPFLRHLQIRIGIPHRLNKKTLIQFPRHNRRTTIPSRLPPHPRIQRQPAFRLLPRRVTFQTVLIQKRTYLLFKKHFPRRIRKNGQRQRKQKTGGTQKHRRKNHQPRPFFGNEAAHLSKNSTFLRTQSRRSNPASTRARAASPRRWARGVSSKSVVMQRAMSFAQ